MDCPQWRTGLSTQHLPSITGTVYDLQIMVSGEATHRVLTSLQQWQPSTALWSTLLGKTISVRLRGMDLSQNAPDGGPFVAPIVPRFTMQ